MGAQIYTQTKEYIFCLAKITALNIKCLDYKKIKLKKQTYPVNTEQTVYRLSFESFFFFLFFQFTHLPKCSKLHFYLATYLLLFEYDPSPAVLKVNAMASHLVNMYFNWIRDFKYKCGDFSFILYINIVLVSIAQIKRNSEKNSKT